MSLKSKIQALITAANAKTGKSDTDLTAAVQSLIDGYGAAVEQISFSLQIYQGGETSDYGTFTATSGTTWADWIGSGRTFDDGLVLIIDGNGHVVNNEGLFELQYGSTTVRGNDEIISGATYTLFYIYG